jgi:hypothetical protein
MSAVAVWSRLLPCVQRHLRVTPPAPAREGGRGQVEILSVFQRDQKNVCGLVPQATGSPCKVPENPQLILNDICFGLFQKQITKATGNLVGSYRVFGPSEA